MKISPINIDPAHLQMIVDATSDLVIISDYQRNIIYVNRTTCEKTGYSKKELLKAKVTFLYPLDHQPEYSAKISNALRKSGHWSGEVETQRKDGTTFWTDSIIELMHDHEGKPSGMIGIGRDISAIKLLDSKEWKSESSLESIMKSMLDGLFVSGSDGSILMCNDAFESMVGLKQDEIVGYKYPYKWLDNLNNKNIVEYFSVVRKHGALRNSPLTIKNKVGKIFHLNLSASILSGKKKKSDEYIFVCRDISNIQYADDLRRMNEQITRLMIDSKRKTFQLEILHEANSMVLNNDNITAVFKSVTSGVKNIVEHDLAGIYVYHQGKNAFIPHTLSEQTKFSKILGKHPLPLGEGIISSAAMSGEMAWANNAQHDPRSIYPEGVKPEIEHFIAVPLMDREMVFGILVVARHRDPQFIEEEAMVIQSFAKVVSVAIENLRLYNELKRYQKKSVVANRNNHVLEGVQNSNVKRWLVNFDELTFDDERNK